MSVCEAALDLAQFFSLSHIIFISLFLLFMLYICFCAFVLLSLTSTLLLLLLLLLFTWTIALVSTKNCNYRIEVKLHTLETWRVSGTCLYILRVEVIRSHYLHHYLLNPHCAGAVRGTLCPNGSQSAPYYTHISTFLSFCLGHLTLPKYLQWKSFYAKISKEK
jgi:hypothetical protein